MDYSELIQKRYSTRQYQNKKVESFKLVQILEAARIAPTGANKQPFKLLVCDNEEALAKVGAAANIYSAPLAVIVCGEIDKAWTRLYDGKNIVETDASVVTTHMMLEATNQGLGNVWICKFEPDVLISKFDFPDGLVPLNILAIGYAGEEPPSSSRLSIQRKKLNELVIYNHL